MQFIVIYGFSEDSFMPKIACKVVKFVKIFFKYLNASTFKKACIAIQALLNHEDPTLYKLNIGASKIKKQSHEQNSRRLLQSELIDFNAYAYSVLHSFNLESKVVLTIDRTNNEFGSTKINYLVLSVVYKNTSIPLYWQMLDNKGGSSNGTQRIELISWFKDNFPDIHIENILADREFPCAEFLSYLLSQNINFIIRSKDVLCSDGDKKIKVSKLYPNLKNLPNQTKIDTKIRRIYDSRVFLHVRLNDKNQRVYLISNQSNINAFQIYRKRWTIENMFGKFKTKGTKLEFSHLSNFKMLSNLFGLMAIAYIISVKIGNFIDSIKPIKIKIIKEYGKTRTTKEFSLFNVGFNFLKNIFTNYLTNKVVTKQLYKLLNLPPNAIINKRLAVYKIMTNF